MAPEDGPYRKKRTKNSVLANLSEIVRRFQKCKSLNREHGTSKVRALTFEVPYSRF